MLWIDNSNDCLYTPMMMMVVSWLWWWWLRCLWESVMWGCVNNLWWWWWWSRGGSWGSYGKSGHGMNRPVANGNAWCGVCVNNLWWWWCGRMVVVDVLMGISQGWMGVGRRMVGVEGVVVVLVVVVVNLARLGYFLLIVSLQNDHTNWFIRNN